MPETTTKAGLGALVKYFRYLGSLGFGGPITYVAAQQEDAEPKVSIPSIHTSWPHRAD